MLEYGDWRAIVYRLPCAKLPLFQLLLGKLLALWEQGDSSKLRAALDTVQLIEDEWQLFQAIASLFRTDPSIPFEVEALRDRPDCLQWLFLFQLDEAGQVQAGELARINTEQPFQPPRRKQDESDEDGMAISDLPFPSSQDADADTLGNLLNAFGDLTTAKLAYEWLDLTTIQNLTYVARELGRSPDDRMKDHLLACFDRYEELDPTILDRAWGFTQDRPNLNQLQADTAIAKQEAIATVEPEPAIEIDPIDRHLLDNWDAEFKAVTQRRTRKRSSAIQEQQNAD